jgi:16S rRNA (uracil1498-N3)-methyltransferase
VTLRRFVIRPDAVDGDRVRFDAAQTRHLARVLRLRPGAIVAATDGAGRTLAVRLDRLDPAGASGTVLGPAGAAAESPCAITLAAGILRAERMRWLVEKATELGVARIVPTLSARGLVRPGPGRADHGVDRWERVAREAVKQCGRATVPAVGSPRLLDAVLAEAPAHDGAWLFWEAGGVPISTAAAELGAPRTLLVLVGPEGGFAPDEVVRAEAQGVRLVGAGPRTLRAESAAVVAVALCQFLFGDLGARTRAEAAFS